MGQCDPSLDLGAATSALLSTAMYMHVRLQQFTDYPLRLCLMSKKWFPATLLISVHAFLVTSPDLLDVGVGAQLHQLAWSHIPGATEMAASAWMLRHAVQSVLHRL